MKQLRYKREWRALEAIRHHLRAGTLIAWYGTDHFWVLNVRRTK
jgi:hypothetical protein